MVEGTPEKWSVIRNDVAGPDDARSGTGRASSAPLGFRHREAPPGMSAACAAGAEVMALRLGRRSAREPDGSTASNFLSLTITGTRGRDPHRRDLLGADIEAREPPGPHLRHPRDGRRPKLTSMRSRAAGTSARAISTSLGSCYLMMLPDGRLPALHAGRTELLQSVVHRCGPGHAVHTAAELPRRTPYGLRGRRVGRGRCAHLRHRRAREPRRTRASSTRSRRQAERRVRRSPFYYPVNTANRNELRRRPRQHRRAHRGELRGGAEARAVGRPDEPRHRGQARAPERGERVDRVG